FGDGAPAPFAIVVAIPEMLEPGLAQGEPGGELVAAGSAGPVDHAQQVQPLGSEPSLRLGCQPAGSCAWNDFSCSPMAHGWEERISRQGRTRQRRKLEPVVIDPGQGSLHLQPRLTFKLFTRIVPE